MAKAVAPGIPHHVTQRGNRQQQTFFNMELLLGRKLKPQRPGPKKKDK
jgi:hypothetical protein